jgi:cytochrome d ubiquinol oxidase subunit II
MTLAEAVHAFLLAGLTAYAVFAGADVGAGIWDLLAGGTRRGARQRDLIEHSIGPVWEANHVWLIFVLVVLWTAFPSGFAALASTLYIPLTLAAIGMIARGSAFAFRKSVGHEGARRLFGAMFAFSSLVTPFFLGTVTGALASGRVPVGLDDGDVVASWVNPTSFLAGALAVGTCSFLAAVFLCADAQREGEADLTEAFRARALASGLVVGALALAGPFVVHGDAPVLYDGLVGRALPCIAVSALAGLASLALLLRRRFTAARVSATLAVGAVVIGWGLAQYPYLLIPDLRIEAAAADPATLQALLTVLLVGSALLVPALVFMYRLFQQTGPQTQARAGSEAVDSDVLESHRN